MKIDAAHPEYKAIVALLDRDFAAFYSKDFDAMAACWTHEPSTCRWGWQSRSGMIARRGWQAIGDRMKVLMRDSPTPQSNVNRRDNLDIHLDHDTAWLTFDQQGDDKGNREMDMPGLCHEMRVLERVDGQWKIAFLLFLNRVPEEVSGPLFRIDAQAKVLWSNAAARALKPGEYGLAIRAGSIRATNRSSNQRLHAALDWAAGVDSLDGRRAALPVILEDVEEDVSHIAWVTAESGVIQLSVNDVGISRERLEAAAIIYGLTSTQRRLASEILIGKSLSDAARSMKISANTARTHLQRMFDKVGVRTQISLVRALLSAASPLR